MKRFTSSIINFGSHLQEEGVERATATVEAATVDGATLTPGHASAPREWGERGVTGASQATGGSHLKGASVSTHRLRYG